MNLGDIAFPNLGLYLRDVPKGFTVFGFEIAIYGVLIGLGVLAGILLVTGWARKTGQNPDLYWDFAVYAIVFSIIGSRIYYVIFTWDQYKEHLLSILNIRQGGMAIYGGVIAAFITLFVFARIRKTSALMMGDTGVLGLTIGQAIGRWGNFTNREVFGEYTDGLLAMRLPAAAVRTGDLTEAIVAHMDAGANFIQVHPTFLYESLWNAGLLCIMLVYWKHKRFTGEIILLYLAGYGLGRTWIEGIRTDQLLWPGTAIPVSQALAVVLFIGASLGDVIIRMRLAFNSRNEQTSD